MAVLHVLIGATGSVASIKVEEIIEKLSLMPNVMVRLVVTEHACHFINMDSLKVKKIDVFTDRDEWSSWKCRGDPVLHIDLRRWADIFLIAPTSANTLAKLAHGLCDNLVSCVARAWDLAKPLILCPAMNTLMYQHPLTSEHLQKVESLGYSIIPPIAKELVCGDVGVGAMASVDTIVQRIKSEHDLLQSAESAKRRLE